MRLIILAISAISIIVAVEATGPRYPPTKGAVWPRPQQQHTTNSFYTLDQNRDFSFKVTNNTCPILSDAINQYKKRLQELVAVVRHARVRPGHNREGVVDLLLQRFTLAPSTRADPHYNGYISRLDIRLTSPCEEYPSFGMDESYTLSINATSELISDSIWGILRGLETFLHSFYITDNFKEIRVNSSQIDDYPSYTHRGLLLDTSRHYISMHNILKTLDAMAMNKMNVFHWHIVDDDSFPYQSEKFPELSEGAYNPMMVYTKNDIKSVIEYARNRGIRVMPEFDVPGHTSSWGVAYPNILTECYKSNKVVRLGPMNPINNSTYKLLRELFQEVQTWFPDRFMHVGGDEVDMDCWASNPDLLEYMNKHNMSSVQELHAMFMENVIPLLAKDTVPVVWQEVYDNYVPLSKETLVHVWKWSWVEEMKKVLASGHRVLFSAAWYLDQLKNGGDWTSFYSADPRMMVHNDTLAKNIVGGEACMWGEVVDDRNVISRVWPRASAVAERLWTGPKDMSRATIARAGNRLEEHTCRMIRHHIDAQPPNSAGFCFF